MNCDALGAIDELIGATAVILTLGYLAIQIRQSGKSSRQQSYHAVVTRCADFFNHMVDSDDVAGIVIAGCRGDEMDEVKAQRFTSAILNYVSHVQDVYLQRKSGVVEEDVWLAERQYLAAVIGYRGFSGWWHAATQYFLPEFVGEVAKLEPIAVVVFDPESGGWTTGTW